MNLDLKQMVNWFLIRGILLIIFSLAAIFFPGPLTNVILIAIGIYVIIISIKFLADMFNKKITKLDKWAIVEIILLVALGALMIFYTDQLKTILGTILGAFAIVVGFFQMIFALTTIGKLRIWMFIGGILGLALGILLFKSPAWGFETLMGLFIGIYLFILGIIFFTLSFYFKSLQKTVNQNSIIER